MTGDLRFTTTGPISAGDRLTTEPGDPSRIVGHDEATGAAVYAVPLTISDFLLARLDEDEAAIRWFDESPTEVQPVDWAPKGMPVTGLDHTDGGYGGEQWYLVADPQRMLAQVEAHRRIVDHCVAVIQEDCDDDGNLIGYYDGTAGARVALFTLRALASVYAGHDDYQAEWAL